MNLMSIVVLIIFIVSGLAGWKRGLLRMTFSVVALILSIILTIIFAPRVEELLYKSTNLDGFFKSKFEKYIDEKYKDKNLTEEEVYNQKSEENGSHTDSIINKYIDEYKSSGVLPDVNSISDGINESTNELSSSIKMGISDKLTDVAMRAASFLITWIVINILLSIVLFMIRGIEKVPIIHGVNKLSGLAIGLIIGLFIVWILFTVVMLIETSEFGADCLRQIMSNDILTKIYEKNMFIKIINSFLK